MTEIRQHGAMEYSTPPVNLDNVRRYRLGRVREQLKKKDVGGLLVFDQLNTRYITDATNMQVWCSHYETRCVFVATEGPVILYDFGDMPHLAEGLPTIDDYRRMIPVYFFGAGSRYHDNTKRFAEEIFDLINTYGGGNLRLALDSYNPSGTHALTAAGLDVVDG